MSTCKVLYRYMCVKYKIFQAYSIIYVSDYVFKINSINLTKLLGLPCVMCYFGIQNTELIYAAIAAIL